MAKRRKSAEAPKPDAMQVIARLLAILVVKGTEKDEAALQLSAAGLDDKIISDMLGVSESYIRVARYRRKKKK